MRIAHFHATAILAATLTCISPLTAQTPKPESPKPEKSTQPTPKAPSHPPTPRLADKGAAPLASYRYSLAEGDKFHIIAQRTTDYKDTAKNGREVAAGHQVTDVELDLRVLRIMSDGTAACAVEVTEYKIGEEQGKRMGGMVGAFADLLKNATGTCLIAPDGTISKHQIGAQNRANITEIFFQPVAYLFSPIPEEAIGVGAAWTAPAVSFRDETTTADPKLPEDIEDLELAAVKPGEVEVSRLRMHPETPESMGGSFLAKFTKNLHISTSGTSTLTTDSGLVPKQASHTMTMTCDALLPSEEAQHESVIVAWSATMNVIKKSEPVAPNSENASKDNAKDELPADFIKTTVTSAGAEPRVLFNRAAPAVGEKASYLLTFANGEHTGEASDKRALDMTEFAFDLSFEVTAVTQAYVEYLVRVDEAKLVKADGVPPAIKPAIEDMAASQKGQTCHWRVPFTHGQKVEKPADPPQDMLELLWEVLPNVPQEPLGIGATWTDTITEPLQEKAKDLAMTAGGRVISTDADTWVLERSESVKGENIKDDDLTASLDSSSVATHTLTPGSILPTKYRHTQKTTITSPTEVGISVVIRREATIDFKKTETPPSEK